MIFCESKKGILLFLTDSADKGECEKRKERKDLVRKTLAGEGEKCRRASRQRERERERERERVRGEGKLEL